MEMDLSYWTIEELSDIIRHFEYNGEAAEAYMMRKMDEKDQVKRSDDMFDLDEEHGQRKQANGASILLQPL